jgi:hypothetical protein
VCGLLMAWKTGWLSALLIRCQVGSYITVEGDLVGCDVMCLCWMSSNSGLFPLGCCLGTTT